MSHGDNREDRQPPREKVSSLDSSIEPPRGIDSRTTLFLYVRAGGCCQFDGCPKYLLEHDPTETPGNFAERAHIYGFKPNAARGSAPGRPADAAINALDNLILLCPECHHLVDSIDPLTYPVETLRKYKADHEERVRALMAIPKDRKAIPVILKGRIADRPFDVSDDELQGAAAPNWLRLRERIEIDLTAIPDVPDEHFWQSAVGAISAKINMLQALRNDPAAALRICVFGVGPMPLLAHLGSRLSDKVEVELYPLHRPRSLQWKGGEGAAHYVTKCVQDGDKDVVALLANLSGYNDPSVLPTTIRTAATIYELTLDGQDPSPLFLETRGDLTRFCTEYTRALATIRAQHQRLDLIHVFPAVPAPVAIELGRLRLPKVDPALLMYDLDKRANGFIPTLEIK